MRFFGFLVGAMLASSCASVPHVGPTFDGVGVSVSAQQKTMAQRQAVESLLPLFLDSSTRGKKSSAIEQALFTPPKQIKKFIGRQKIPKSGRGIVEVKIDPLSEALQRAGLVRPTEYVFVPPIVLLALGDRSAGPAPMDRVAADALETALFGRGIQAQDADDRLLELKRKLTAKTEAETLIQATEAGWPWLVTGGVAGSAQSESLSDSWRGRAHLALKLYDVGASTMSSNIDVEAQSIEVSSVSAVTRAIEAVAQEASLRIEKSLAFKRAGRATIAVLVSGQKNPVFLNRVIADLRRIEGIEGAALISWHGLDQMALIHAYAAGLATDGLAARLIAVDPKLRVTGVETEDGRLTIEGAQIPESEDAGQE